MLRRVSPFSADQPASGDIANAITGSQTVFFIGASSSFKSLQRASRVVSKAIPRR